MDEDIDSPSTQKVALKEAMLRPRRLAKLTLFENIMRLFSPAERLLLYGFTITLSFSALALVAGANATVSVYVPSSGGVLTEGQVGPARFINPVLTMSQADEDLTELVYSGLTRALPDGSVIPDIASSYEVSADGTIYTFTLRTNALFHDGVPVTSADVLYTVQTIQNPSIKSPHRADWEGVSVAAPDPYTVVFTLPRAYAPFIENTTLGILPSHVWEGTSPEEFPFSPANTRPVGSGPYRISDMKTSSTGSVTRYDLVAFKSFTLGQAYIKRISFIFYPSEEAMLTAFNQGKVDAVAGVSPKEIGNLTRTDTTTLTSPLPRVFGVFFNQAHAPVLADAYVRDALDAALDKQRLVDTVLYGYGVPLNSPIPPGIIGEAPRTRHIGAPATEAYTSDTLEAARAILKKGGWSFDEESGTWTKKKLELSFTMSTADSPELLATANAVAAAWQALGAHVTVQTYSLSELNTAVLRPRQYDAILFGEVVGRELDLFAFWHSSQRNDPGLNLSLYTSSQADTLLSKARATTIASDRDKLYTQFATLIQEDMPAVFLYTPEFVYIVPEQLQGVQLGAITTPSERFQNVYEWYADTERVWSIFARDGGTQ
jgi:peptide/nickel transport system substrate-binding protein